MIAVAILGGTGFGAGELLRILVGHPEVKVVAATSRSKAGEKYSSVHPHLASIYDDSFISELTDEVFEGFNDLCVVSALPHGESGRAIQEVRAKFPQAKIIDLSGDLRLKDLVVHREFYGHSEDLEELRSLAVYGCPEVSSAKIKNATLISNPGCLATAATLSLLPLSGKRINSVHLHLATGSSGSGKDPKASTHHPVRHANFLAYKTLEHQHVPEVIQCLNENGGAFENLPFVAHSLPISRGILCTTFLDFEEDQNQKEIESTISTYYLDKPFVRFKGNTPAEIENVVGSNFCDISVKVKGKQVVVHAAIDNLVKGMAGQAIHNLNLMFGLPEKTGLWFGGWRPV